MGFWSRIDRGSGSCSSAVLIQDLCISSIWFMGLIQICFFCFCSDSFWTDCTICWNIWAALQMIQHIWTGSTRSQQLNENRFWGILCDLHLNVGTSIFYEDSCGSIAVPVHDLSIRKPPPGDKGQQQQQEEDDDDGARTDINNWSAAAELTKSWWEPVWLQKPNGFTC